MKKISISETSYYATVSFDILGYYGETNSRTIEVEQPVVEGADTYKLRFKYSDGVVYDVLIENNAVNITGSLLREVGKIQCQWIASKSTGDAYDFVAKSQMFSLCIEASIGDDVAPIPSYEAAKDVADKVLEAEEIVAQNTVTVENAADFVKQAEQTVSHSSTIAQQAAQTAEQKAAETAELAAQVDTAVSTVQNTVEQVEQNTIAIETKLDKPQAEGETGQVLQTGENGETVWADVMTEIEKGSVTPEKTSFFTPSDIEYEIVEGKKLNGNNIIDDENAFTVFVKIPQKIFAWIAATPSNTEYPFGTSTRIAGSLICNANKESLGSYGFTDNNRNLCVIRGDNVSNYEGAAYFALSYLNGTEFDFKIGGANTCVNPELPLSNTELGEDFFISGSNRLYDVSTNVDYMDSLDRWAYTSLPVTNFFEVENGKAYYHNGSYVYLVCFDENYGFVGNSGNFVSGATLSVADNVKYAYAKTTTATGIAEGFWFSSEDLSRNANTPYKIVNPYYLDIRPERKYIKSWYNGKRVSFMGDSLTDGGLGGYYINYLNNFFGFGSITRSAKGGTWVSGATSSMGAAFWEDSRVNQLDPDSDIVFIMGGTNDANNSAALGDSDISNCDTNTFYGAYHVLISKLIYKYYKLDTGYYSDIDYSGVTQADEAKPVQIFLITPPYMLNSESQYNKTPAYCEAVIDIGKQLGCPVCDIRANSGVNIFAKEYYKSDYNNTGNYDYTHLSVDAHKHWSKVIIGKMLETEMTEGS